MKYLIFLLLIFICCSSWAKEELVVIQTVANDQKSFVIAKGLKDGISKGQELIFANENVSLVCKAVEVNRNFSYWKPLNENMTVPFLREEIVGAVSHVYGSLELDLVADQAELIEKLDTENEIKFFRKSNYYSLRGSVGTGLTQSTSSVSTDQNSKRFAFDLSLEYNLRLQPEYDVGLGVRYDNDVYRITNPTLDIPTNRYMAIISATYHLIAWSHDKNNAYISIAAGAGLSKTTVNQAIASGYATMLPQMRLGYMMPFARKNAMMFEASVESISSTETFDDNTKQNSSYLNFKATVGVTF